eukprot:362301-Chlamydomonas_euryale.AAC.4
MAGRMECGPHRPRCASIALSRASKGRVWGGCQAGTRCPRALFRKHSSLQRRGLDDRISSISNLFYAGPEDGVWEGWSSRCRALTDVGHPAPDPERGAAMHMQRILITCAKFGGYRSSVDVYTMGDVPSPIVSTWWQTLPCRAVERTGTKESESQGADHA